MKLQNIARNALGFVGQPSPMLPDGWHNVTLEVPRPGCTDEVTACRRLLGQAGLLTRKHKPGKYALTIQVLGGQVTNAKADIQNLTTPPQPVHSTHFAAEYRGVETWSATTHRN